jgi:hypothetical protein
MREHTLDGARSICAEILGRYHVAFSDYQEERKDGEIKFVYLTLKFKVFKKRVDKSSLSE